MYRVTFRKDLNLLDIEWLAMFEPDRVGDYARKLRDQFDAEGFVPGYLVSLLLKSMGKLRIPEKVELMGMDKAKVPVRAYPEGHFGVPSKDMPEVAFPAE